MEDVVLRLEELLFPAIPDVAVLAVDVNNETVRVEACCTAVGAVCPGCGDRSSRVHGSYLRLPADLPSAGRRVVLCLKVRRFMCGNPSCDRRTFVEQVSGLTRRFGRWTEGLRSTLTAVGLALAGRAGARIAGVFGASVSRSTVLRMAAALPEPEPPAPRVVGVDEYATRKGRVYGTVLVDVETRRPVDLLPDREASSLAAWLTERPGIESVFDLLLPEPDGQLDVGGLDVSGIPGLRIRSRPRSRVELFRPGTAAAVTVQLAPGEGAEAHRWIATLPQPRIRCARQPTGPPRSGRRCRRTSAGSVMRRRAATSCAG
ncbi:transposase family protein [Streptomyces roseoverticillatus]|uniref:transposase family protein n=1 Tax=Streptomyces roseoverticillatus TaxID=66429 RepID=UPI001F48CC9B|nr:transposase family protein [Streptomyces roseoverticillatus]